MSERIDMTGQTFGLLTVLHRAESQNRKCRWMCRCKCGATTVVRGQRLRAGVTRSCGCLAKMGTYQDRSGEWRRDSTTSWWG